MGRGMGDYARPTGTERLDLSLASFFTVSAVELLAGNCILRADGYLVLSDFGLCAEIESRPTGRSGTRGYWAPEVRESRCSRDRVSPDRSFRHPGLLGARGARVEI